MRDELLQNQPNDIRSETYRVEKIDLQSNFDKVSEVRVLVEAVDSGEQAEINAMKYGWLYKQLVDVETNTKSEDLIDRKISGLSADGVIVAFGEKNSERLKTLRDMFEQPT